MGNHREPVEQQTEATESGSKAGSMKRRQLTAAEATKWFRETLTREVVPCLQEVLEIWERRQIPMVFDLGGTAEEHREAWREGFKWNGEHVLGVDREHIRPIMEQPTELRWLETRPSKDGPVHVLLWTGMGSLLLIGAPDGWSIAPGTTDAQLLN